MKMHDVNSDNFIIFFAALLNFGAGIVVDLYAPALPQIAEEFHSSNAIVQATIVFSIVGYAAGQFVFGLLSDWLGRRVVLLGGIGLFIMAALAAFFAPSIAVLLISRCIQGFSTGVCQVTARAIISDRLGDVKFQRAIVYLSLAFALGLILGPYIGAFIEKSLGWRYTFMAYFLYGLIVAFMATFGLRETLLPQARQLPKGLFGNLALMYQDRIFVGCMIQLGCCFFCFTFWSQVGPLIIVQTLHKSSLFFANTALATGMAYLFGTIINRIIGAYTKPERRISIGLLIAVLGAMPILLSGDTISLKFLVVGLTLIVFAQGLMFPNILARAMRLFKERAALAASLQGMGMLIVGFFGLGLFSVIPINNGLMLSITYMLFIFISVFVQIFLIKAK